VVALVDTSGNVKASYSYDAFGALTSSSETLANGWSNPYRYDGAELVRYDTETNLYWMRVRAYDPTLGRFISHDPLGRLAAMGPDVQPYIYAGNNPVNHTDPSGMLFSSIGTHETAVVIPGSNGKKPRVIISNPPPPHSEPTPKQQNAEDILRVAAAKLMGLGVLFSAAALALLHFSDFAIERGGILLIMAAAAAAIWWFTGGASLILAGQLLGQAAGWFVAGAIARQMAGILAIVAIQSFTLAGILLTGIDQGSRLDKGYLYALGNMITGVSVGATGAGFFLGIVGGTGWVGKILQAIGFGALNYYTTSFISGIAQSALTDAENAL
jgi:RHS repeat-associated protein